MFFPGLFTLVACCLAIYLFLLKGNLNEGEPYWFISLAVLLILALVIDAVAMHKISKLRQSNFKLTFLQDSILTRQLVLAGDLKTSLLSTRNPLLGILARAILLLRGIKIIREHEMNIQFTDIESAFIRRGFWNRLFGTYKVIVLLKNVQYSKFIPPATIDYAGDVVGDLSPEGTFNSFLYRGVKLVVIPGLNNDSATKLMEMLKSRVPNFQISEGIPGEVTPLSITKALLYGIVAFVIYFLLIIMLSR